MALKATKNHVPESVTGIASMMEMDAAEIRAWPYMNEVRAAIKDYNLGALDKQRMFTRLNDIAVKNSADELVHYAEGIENLITSIRLSY